MILAPQRVKLILRTKLTQGLLQIYDLVFNLLYRIRFLVCKLRSMSPVDGEWSGKQRRFLSSLNNDNQVRRIRQPSVVNAQDDSNTSDDPEEVDISQMNYNSSPGADRKRQIQQMMGDSRYNSASASDMPGDPFAFLQQLGDIGAGGNSFSMFGASGQMGNDMNFGFGTQDNVSNERSRGNLIWKILHMATMIVLVTTLQERSIPFLKESIGVIRPAGQPVFWYFITLELVLQTSRLLISGAVVQDSIFTKIGQMLPPPYNGYMMVAARYSLIWTDLRDDFCFLLAGLALRAYLLS